MPQVEVKGMHCKNCQAAVTKALEGLGTLVNVNVNLEKGLASWEDKNPQSPESPENVKKAIRDIGFDA